MFPIVFNTTKKNAIHLTEDDKLTLCGVDITPIQKDDYQYMRVSYTQHPPTCGKCVSTIRNLLIQHFKQNPQSAWPIFNQLGLNPDHVKT